MAPNIPITAIRLRERMEETGTSQSDLADAIGITQGAISQILTGATRNSRFMPKIAQGLAINLNWLLGVTDEKIEMFDKNGNDISEDTLAAIKAGIVENILLHPDQIEVVGAADRRQGFRGPPPALPAPEPDPDHVEIDMLDLAYGMGGTFVDIGDDGIEAEKVRFSRSWLRQFTHAPPHLLFTTKGVGDSMWPTIGDNDVVVINRAERVVEFADKIWAVVYGGVGSIKRLRPLPDGSVELHSDNQMVRPARATDGDLHIVGRVVAVVRKV